MYILPYILLFLFVSHLFPASEYVEELAFLCFQLQKIVVLFPAQVGLSDIFLFIFFLFYSLPSPPPGKGKNILWIFVVFSSFFCFFVVGKFDFSSKLLFLLFCIYLLPLAFPKRPEFFSEKIIFFACFIEISDFWISRLLRIKFDFRCPMGENERNFPK